MEGSFSSIVFFIGFVVVSAQEGTEELLVLDMAKVTSSSICHPKAPSFTPHLMNNALHAVLVKAVRQVSGISSVFDNRWITWVHNWSATKVRSPDLYCTAFLSDYLCDIGNKGVTEKETADLFESALAGYVRPEGELKKMRFSKS